MDDNLRSRFDALRREESAGTPRYEQLVQSDEPANSARGRFEVPWRWLPAAALAVLVVWWVVPSRPPPESLRFEPISSPRWTMPTDVLLIIPGSELLRRPPRIGTESIFPSVLPRTEAPRRMRG